MSCFFGESVQLGSDKQQTVSSAKSIITPPKKHNLHSHCHQKNHLQLVDIPIFRLPRLLVLKTSNHIGALLCQVFDFGKYIPEEVAPVSTVEFPGKESAKIYGIWCG